MEAGESNQLWTIENLLQDARLPAMAPILLSSTPALFRPGPPRFLENRGGGAHVGHKMLKHDRAIDERALSCSRRFKT